jgi:hypothetical protein
MNTGSVSYISRVIGFTMDCGNAQVTKLYMNRTSTVVLVDDHVSVFELRPLVQQLQHRPFTILPCLGLDKCNDLAGRIVPAIEAPARGRRQGCGILPLEVANARADHERPWS